MRIWISGFLGLWLGALPGAAQSPASDASNRPQIRPVEQLASEIPSPRSPEDFGRWIGEFRTRALGQGISANVFDRAMQGVEYNEGIVEKDRNQSEFTKQIWEYLDSANSEARIANGKAALRDNATLLSQVEAKYSVEKQIVAAIWGLESAYGTFRGSVPIIEALATLAFDARRSDFFEEQLLAALKILQSGDTTPANMTGSWAGAMGHTQFMPNSYLAYAQDFTGDGKRDIWGDNPADALASTAAYLKHFGWKQGQPWGIEVILPDGFDYAQSGERIKKPVSFWNEKGIRDINGKQIAEHGRSSILLPAGAQGAAFIIFDNFHVLERYNTADAYVIAVGHLADLIIGGAPIQSGWPRDDRALSFDEKIEMQDRLTKAGFDTEGLDGIIGPNTIAAVKAYQASLGLIPDGYASLKILERLR